MAKLEEPTSVVAQYAYTGNILATLLVYLAVSTLLGFWNAPRYPTNIPWAGHGKGWLASLRNTFAGLSQARTWLHDGYHKYSKAGKAFVLPPFLGGPAEVIIPCSEMQWLVDLPDKIASTREAHYDTLHGAYNFVQPIIVKDPYHEHVLHKHLARNLHAVIPEMDDEVSRDVDEMLGKDTENFKKLDSLDGFFMRLVPKITNRMLLGEPICRNKDFLAMMSAYTMDVVRGMLVFAILPRFLHTVFGPIHSLFPKYHNWRAGKYTIPVIKQRIHDIKRKEAGDPEYKDWETPNDYVTWSIKTAMAEGRQDELVPSRIATRILPLNFASIHTTSMTAHNALTDILSSDPSALEELREEAERVHREENGKWTKQGLARMYRMDSAIRESQRFSAISLTFIQRKVLVKEGITSPSGVHLAYGTFLSCPWNGVSMDEGIHQRPDIYDPFRFSRPREEYEAMSAEEKASVDTLKMKQTGLVTTSSNHFPFGHGRHACPGRFFVSHEIKMIFAHMLMNYEIKHIEKRPDPIWIGKMVVPAQVEIEFRRRRN